MPRNRVTPADTQGEFEKLVRSEAKYGIRVRRMLLTDSERDFVSYTIHKNRERKEEGARLYRKGQRNYAVQMVCSAIVPVLIGILGSFPEVSWLDTAIRVCAIVLSIVGTLTTAVEGVYHNRLRGESIKRIADQMNGLFQEYDTLSGPRFAIDEERTLPAGGLKSQADVGERTHGGVAFRIYSEAFNDLQCKVREALFLGSPASGGGREGGDPPRSSPSVSAKAP